MHEARPLWSASAPENNRGAVPRLQDTRPYPLATSPRFSCFWHCFTTISENREVQLIGNDHRYLKGKEGVGR
jgi:hypothetical protein